MGFLCMPALHKESANAQTSSSSFHLDWVNQVCSLLTGHSTISESISQLSFWCPWYDQSWGKLHPKVTTIAARQLEDPFGLFTQSLRVKMPLPLKDRSYEGAAPVVCRLCWVTPESFNVFFSDSSFLSRSQKFPEARGFVVLSNFGSLTFVPFKWTHTHRHFTVMHFAAF